MIGCDHSKNVNSAVTDEFYSLNIQVADSIARDKKVKIELQENAVTTQVSYPGKIERRGGYSMQFAKHSYEIDLKQDVSIAGLPADDDWILNANYIDKTFLRHVLSYELFMEMNPSNIAPRCAYVEVELNGTYNGLYVLMEKLDRSSLNIEKSDSMAMIFKEPHIFRTSYDGIVPAKANNFHQQKYPKVKKDNKRDYLEELRTFILNTTDESFQKKVSNIFDMSNIIDWHLLLLISNNSDGILKNFYLYKTNNNTPIRIAPWDYDHSFGRDGDNELNLDERPMNIERSILFKRLLRFDWYKKRLNERWLALNTNQLLSANGLKKRVLSKAEQVKKAAKKNFERWPVDGPWYYDANSFEQEIDIMLKFIDLRHHRLTSYFKEL